MARRRTLIAVGLLVLIVGVFYITRRPLLRQIGAFPTIADQLQPVDLINFDGFLPAAELAEAKGRKSPIT